MRAAFVTGGTGFVGWHVAKALLAEGWAVRVLARPGRRALLDDLGAHGAGQVQVVAGDLTTPESFRAALEGCAAVVHVAGLVKARSLDAYRKVNTEGTARLVAEARAVCPEALFVQVSTQAAAGPARGGRPVAEGDPPRPVSWYGISKLEGERAVAAAWPGPWVVLRPGVLYGPRDSALLTYFRMARRGWLPVPAARSRIHVEPVEGAALGIARAASRPDLAGRVGFLTDPQAVTVGELARGVAEAGGHAVRLLQIPAAAVSAAGWLETLREAVTRRSRPFNADKAREILAGDWLCDPAPMRRDLSLPPPPSLAEGLAAAWRWYREKGWV